MALGGKTVQYTLAVDLETGQLSAESRKVANDLGLIQKKTKDADGSFLEFGKQAKHLKSELSLLFLGSFGGYALVVGVLTDAIQQTGLAIQETFSEKAIPKDLDEFLTAQLKNLRSIGLTQRQIFEFSLLEIQTKEEIIKLENERAVKNRQYASENWWKFLFGQTGSVAFFSGMAAETSDLNYGISELEKTVKGFTDRAQAIDELTSGFQAADDAAKKTKVSIDNVTNALKLMRDLPGNPLSFLTSGTALQTRMSPNLNLIQPAQDIQGGLPESPVGGLKTELDELVESAGLYKSFLYGLADAFSSIGESIANGRASIKTFGAVFLQLIADLAKQFGAFLIAYGGGLLFIPGMEGRGAGAIAAGVALSVLGGALGAIASRGGATRGVSSEREARFRDSKFGTSGGNGGTTIYNSFSFSNVVGLTDSGKKELMDFISREQFRRERLNVVTV